MLEKNQITDSPSLLSVAVDIAFTPTRLGTIVGYVTVDFTIENRSRLDAIVPFLAFSLLGLRFMKKEGWVQDHFAIQTSKRMVRFRSGQQSLEAGKRTTPCSLRIPFTLKDGGCLRLLPGSEQQISEVSDIKLFYVVGAANFAPERSFLLISANKIRSHVNQAFPWVQTEQDRLDVDLPKENTDQERLLTALSEWFPPMQ